VIKSGAEAEVMDRSAERTSMRLEDEPPVPKVRRFSNFPFSRHTRAARLRLGGDKRILNSRPSLPAAPGTMRVT